MRTIRQVLIAVFLCFCRQSVGKCRQAIDEEPYARWFSHTSVPTFITSDNDKLSEVIKMLGNKDCDYSVNGIISAAL